MPLDPTAGNRPKPRANGRVTTTPDGPSPVPPTAPPHLAAEVAPAPSYRKLTELKLAALVRFELTGEGKRPDVSRVDPDVLSYIDQALVPWKRDCKAFGDTRAEHATAVTALKAQLSALQPADLLRKQRAEDDYRQKTGRADRALGTSALFAAAALACAAADALLTAYAIREAALFGEGLRGLVLTGLVGSFVSLLTGACFEIGFFQEFCEDDDERPA